MNQGKNSSNISIIKNNKVVHTFKQVLIKKGLLNPITGTMLVRSISDVDRLLTKWKQVANAFTHKGKKVHVSMVCEWPSIHEGRVWPEITPTTS